MGKLFVYDRTKEFFCEGLGITIDEFQSLHRKLYEMIIDDIKLGIQEGDSIIFTESKAEYAQGLAEHLNRDLTPEIGLGIGLILADIDEITDEIMKRIGMDRNSKESS